MKAIKLWNHDAYFDYVDRWMQPEDTAGSNRQGRRRPSRETTTFDPFVTAMWKAHRANALAQEMAGNPRRSVWKGKEGVWVPNPM